MLLADNCFKVTPPIAVEGVKCGLILWLGVIMMPIRNNGGIKKDFHTSPYCKGLP